MATAGPHNRGRRHPQSHGTGSSAQPSIGRGGARREQGPHSATVLAALRTRTEGFAGAADVGCVTGPILPAKLTTHAQLVLERRGSRDDGFEGFSRIILEHRLVYQPAAIVWSATSL
jgi:hypothetical protein